MEVAPVSSPHKQCSTCPPKLVFFLFWIVGWWRWGLFNSIHGAHTEVKTPNWGLQSLGFFLYSQFPDPPWPSSISSNQVLPNLAVSRKVISLWSKAYRTGPRGSSVCIKDSHECSSTATSIVSKAFTNLLLKPIRMSGTLLHRKGSVGHGDCVWSSFVIKHHVSHIYYQL